MHRILTLVHLYIATFLAPGLLLMCISGGLDMFGFKGNMTATEISIPADTTLDFKSATFDSDVRDLLNTVDDDYDFEYLRTRGNMAFTRPTSRIHYVLKGEEGGLSVIKNEPDLQATLMELHKGHGPRIFKTYSKFVAFGLFILVISGLWLGLVMRHLRSKTMITTAAGLALFLVLVLV